jgi:addiction module HigA family antidote
MIPENRTPTHPGDVLKQEFLDPLGISPAELGQHIGVSTRQINEILRGKRGVTAETAWLLAQALDTSPEFWLNLQSTFDLARSRPARQTKRLEVVR